MMKPQRIRVSGDGLVYTNFEDLNRDVYSSAEGIVLDGLIWCLGPYVDDSRPYGRFRICLAGVTRAVVRRLYRIAD